MSTLLKVVLLGLLAWLYISYVQNLGGVAVHQLNNLKQYYDPAFISQVAQGDSNAR